MKSEKKNILVDVIYKDGDKSGTLWLAEPLESEMRVLATTLAKLFTLSKSGEYDALVICRDWDILLELSEQQVENLERFFNRAMVNAILVDSDSKEVVDLSILTDGDIQLIKGSILFTIALLRYLPQAAVKILNNGKDITTSLNGEEYINSLKKSSSQSTIKTEEKKKLTPSIS